MNHTLRLFAVLVALSACKSSSSKSEPRDKARAIAAAAATPGATDPAACTDPSSEVAGHLTHIGGVTTDGTRIYFLTGRTELKSVPVGGGEVTTLTDKLSRGPMMASPAGGQLATDATTVYVVTEDSIEAVAKSGGEVRQLVKAPQLHAIALDGDALYYTQDGTEEDGRPHGAVKRIAIAGGDPTVLAAGLAGPSALLVDADHVYTENLGSRTLKLYDKMKLPARVHDGGIIAIAKSGGAPRALFTVPSDGKGTDTMGFGLIDDGANLYFTAGNLENLSALSGMLKLPKTGGEPTRLAGYSTMGGFVAHGRLYELNGNSIAKFELASGARTELACLGTDHGSLSMTHDATRIYFARREGGGNFSIRSLPQ